MPTTTGGAIARAAAEVGAIVGAKALVAFTMTGETARRLARYRSPIPLLAFTTDPAIRSQLALTWGVETFIVPTVHHTDDMVHEVDSALVSLEPLRHRRQDRHRGGQPARQPGQDQRAARPPIGDAINLPIPDRWPCAGEAPPFAPPRPPPPPPARLGPPSGAGPPPPPRSRPRVPSRAAPSPDPPS